MSLMCGGGGGDADVDPELAKINAEVCTRVHVARHRWPQPGVARARRRSESGRTHSFSSRVASRLPMHAQAPYRALTSASALAPLCPTNLRPCSQAQKAVEKENAANQKIIKMLL
jgi:hypothetical protein